MKIAFITEHRYLPQRVGGSETSIHELVTALQAKGHTCVVFSRLGRNGWLYFFHRLFLLFPKIAVSHDELLGYKVYRSLRVSADIETVIKLEKPDILVAQAGGVVKLAKKVQESNSKIPIVVYIRDILFEDLDGDPRSIKDAIFIANSDFVATTFNEKFGIRPYVLPPIFLRNRYLCATTGEFVTFINTHLYKGLELAIKIAQLCPEIPFLFVEGWPLERSEKMRLLKTLRKIPNVQFMPRTNDMKQVYRKTHILLVPSQWQESWGRVVTEAHFNGIPVIASNTGGLEKTVGPGGTVLPFDAEPEKWAELLKLYWGNKNLYAKKSKLALQYSLRDEINTTKQVLEFESMLVQAVSKM